MNISKYKQLHIQSILQNQFDQN